MPFLLGLKFLKSKPKEPLPKLPSPQQEIREEKASTFGYGEQKIAQMKRSARGKDLPDMLTLAIPIQRPEKPELNVKSSTQDGYGVLSTKKTSSSHSKVESSAEDGYGIREEEVSTSGYGDKKIAHKNSSSGGNRLASMLTLEIPTAHPDTNKLNAKSSTQNGYGDSRKKKTSSSHSKLKSSTEDGYGVSKAYTEDGDGVSSTKKASSSSSRSKVKSSTEDGYGVSSTKRTSSSHSKVKSSTEHGYGVSSTKKTSSSQSKVKSSTENGYGVSSTKTSSSHSKVKKNGLPSAQAPVTRKNFCAVKNVRKDETFTNNESLPAMDKAYRQFIRLYPEYLQTSIVNKIRAQEYAYLNEGGHVCLDYSGYGLFSKWQETWQKASASFGLSCISVNLPIHALYGGADEGTVEYDIKKKVSEFFNIQESEYMMVFTASRSSAFKLLGESYPFHLNKKLLSVYDYESEAVKWLEEAAQRRCAEVMSARFRWPSQRLWATDLKNKLFEKKKNKKEPGKGLFIFPVQSRVTGTKYSYQWMSQAQENGWDILLDASALGPNAMGSLGLCVFRPDFIVSSFFKVYGSDPTGFGCLMIKRSAIARLHSSSAARGVGMVRLVPIAPLSSGQPKGCEIEEMESVMNGSARATERRHTGSTYTNSGPIQEMESAANGSARLTERRQPRSTYAHSGPIWGGTKAESSLAKSKSLRATSGEPATVGDDQRKLRRVQKSEASYSTSGMEARQGNQSFSNEKSLSLTKPQQNTLTSVDEITEVYSFDDFEEPEEVESAYRLHQRNHRLQEEDKSHPRESMSSTVFDSLGENEASTSCILPHNERPGQPHVSTSAFVMDDEKDSSFVYSEDASPASFLDDEDLKDASFPCQEEKDDDDDDAREFVVDRKDHEIVCRGLEHAHKLGLNGTNTRLRCLTNWLIASMLKLRHPGSPDAHCLIQIYGPKVNYDRGASVVFNLFDYKGNLLQPLLVQRLADRRNISFGVTTLKNLHVPKSSASWPNYSEHLSNSVVSRGDTVEASRSGGKSPSIEAISVSLCFLSNFEDVYRFWVFLANFLDADFVSKEVWRYRSLNQETVLLGEPSKSSAS